MPAGVTWSQYLRVVAASMLSMLAGAQVVHTIYRPLDDLDELVKREIEKRKKGTMSIADPADAVVERDSRAPSENLE